MFCTILYYLYNLKNVKNTHGGVLLLVLKVTLLHWWFPRFLNSTNGTKSRKTSHMFSGGWKVVSIWVCFCGGKREFSTMRWFNPAGNYTFKVNSKNTRTKWWNMYKVNNKNVCPVCLLLTLNIFYNLFKCFYS